MSVEVGTVYEGKVTGITKFGAFVQLPGGKSGMVHISEIANTYVDDITKHLQEGQTVSVKVIGIDQQNRINLSIKKALPGGESQPGRPPRPQGQGGSGGAPRQGGGPGQAPPRSENRAPRQSTLQKTDDDSFEGKLKAFMQSSESRMSDIRSQREGRGGGGGRRRK